MRIARIDQILETCEDHLTSTESFGTEVESLLTQSLLVLMCSEFERQIKSIVEHKCSTITDAAVREFIGSCTGAVFRSVLSGEIAGLLKRFGPNYKEAFKKKADDNQRAVTFYNNIVTNRHSAAHSDGSGVTFGDVKQFYEQGHLVLDFFQDSLLLHSGKTTLGIENER